MGNEKNILHLAVISGISSKITTKDVKTKRSTEQNSPGSSPGGDACFSL